MDKVPSSILGRPIKKEMVNNKTLNLAAIIVGALFVYGAFLVVKPYFNAIVIGIILTFLFHPLYEKLNKKSKNPKINAILLSILVIVLVAVPSYLLVSNIFKEANGIYNSYRTDRIILPESCEEETLKCRTITFFNSITAKPIVQEAITQTLKELVSEIVGSITSAIKSLPRIIFSIVIIITVFLTLLIEGKTIMESTTKLLPLHKYRTAFINNFSSLIHGLLYGSFIIGVIQAALMIVFLFILGVPNPYIWGITAGIGSFIPFIGGWIAWLPLSMIYFLGDPVWKGIAILIFGIVINSPIDIYVKTKVIGGKASMEPALLMIGLLGGVAAFGVIGFLLGPLILAFLISYLEVHKES